LNKRRDKPYVVDTNVAVVANGRSPQADDALVEACIERLLIVTEKGRVAVDTDDRIFDEYRDNLCLSGQPGTGDMFMKWLHDNQWNESLCDRRKITCTDEANQLFAEILDQNGLRNFDLSDLKFIAVASAAEPKAIILEAVDFKWWGWKEDLVERGVTVQFIDPDKAQEGWRRKFFSP
jgi:hypothetical protein